jgi:hypothetical protein
LYRYTEILSANASDADAAKAAVLDLVYSVNSVGNQRVKDELHQMGMKDVLSVLGSRKPFDWAWPPPPNPPPPPLAGAYHSLAIVHTFLRLVSAASKPLYYH